MSQKKAFSSLRELLPGLLGKLSTESGKAAGLLPIWEEVAGPAIARSALPDAIHGGVLTFRVVDARWKAELEQRQGELLARLNEKLGEHTLTGLRFVVYA